MIRSASLRRMLLAIVVMGFAPLTFAQDVRIEGGQKIDGNYAWTVTNHTQKPIVELSFPHYQGDLFNGPDGWDVSQCTYLVNIGVPDEPGVCRAIAPNELAALRPGQSAEIALRIVNNPKAKRGRNDVTVKFADGSETVVPNIELPVPPPASESVVMLSALGVLLIAFLIFHSRKKKPAPAGGSDSAPA